jgi:FSR family fosmidomycin resistance protein-like MFS transporter
MGSGREAAWPLLRSDLSFSYVQIGILVSLPGIVSSLIGPVFGILADVGRRRALILGGGVACALAMTLSAISQSFWSLLVSFILLHPASGAFVCLSQVALMDHDPERREQNMARWTLAGSLGVVGGPLAIGAGTALGIGWRGLFLVFAGLTALLVAAAWRYPFPNSNGQREPEEALTFCDGLRNAWQALRLFEVRRWLVLLQFSDFQ